MLPAGCGRSADYPLRMVFAGGAKHAQVPFDVCFNIVFIPGSTGGGDSAWFILDTGFEYSLLNRDRLDSAQIANAPTRVEKQPGGEVEVTTVYDIAFALRGLEIAADSIRAIPLGGLEPVAGRRIDGIIGHEFFERFVVTVDYANQVLTVTEPAEFDYRGNGDIIPVLIENNEPFITAEVRHPDGNFRKAKLKLDTGSADFIGFNGSYVQAIGLVADSQARVPALGTAVGGHTDNWVTRLAAFRAGSFTIYSPVVGYSVDLTRGGDAGTIGGEFFRRFKATFDYNRRRLILDANAALADRVEYDMSGVFPIADPPDFGAKRVLAVTPGSAAERVGIQAGDLMTTVNGVPAGSYSICELRQLFMQPGGEIELAINRQDSLINVVLVLEPMI
ncbi:MAG: PDZ domain-containing protein [Candidatus Zixiibacteriota bacterium]|nr:MAG: PDZ domain-containing protein [candidate division Zixibacteria bacterium]